MQDAQASPAAPSPWGAAPSPGGGGGAPLRFNARDQALRHGPRTYLEWGLAGAKGVILLWALSRKTKRGVKPMAAGVAAGAVAGLVSAYVADASSSGLQGRHLMAVGRGAALAAGLLVARFAG